MADRPQLNLINTDTGEVVEDEREILIEQLQTDLKTKQLALGKLKRELKELRSVEPEANVVRDVLNYWKGLCSPRAHIAPAGKRWEKVRARLKDKLDGRDPWTPAELKLAVDGALLDPWLNGTARGSKGYLDAETIFKSPEQVERLVGLALGFTGEAGVSPAQAIELWHELRWHGFDSSWLLDFCLCGHRRVFHARHEVFDTELDACLLGDCDCERFDLDVLERLT